jgi:PIN domain
MAALIDSSVLIAAERGQVDFDVISARYAEEDVAISAVTASELLHCLYGTRTPSSLAVASNCGNGASSWNQLANGLSSALRAPS